MNAFAAGKLIVEVNCCPVAATEKACPQAKLPQVLRPHPIPVNVDSSTVAAPMLEVAEIPVTGTPISITLLPIDDVNSKPVALNVNDIPATSSPREEVNWLPVT